MRRGSADSIRASGNKVPHQQAGYKTAICLPVTPKSVLASREASIQCLMNSEKCCSHCCLVYVLVELRVSSSVSHQWVCSGDAPLPSSGSRWARFPAFSGTIRALRLPAPAWPSAYWFRQPAPRAPAGVRVRPVGRSRRRAGPATGRGLDCSRWQSPFQRSCPRARAGSPRFPGDPSRDFATIHDPGRPVAPRL